MAPQEEPLTAHCALVTLPLGVLKANHVEFCPALPPFKQLAIDRLDMGTENRVAMIFPKVTCCWIFILPDGISCVHRSMHALGNEAL